MKTFKKIKNPMFLMIIEKHWIKHSKNTQKTLKNIDKKHSKIDR
jgi:hypothetical protein